MPSAVSPPPELPVSGCITLRKLAAGAVQRHSCVSGAWARLIALHRGQPVPRGPGGAGGAGGERAAGICSPTDPQIQVPDGSSGGRAPGAARISARQGGRGGLLLVPSPGVFHHLLL